MSMSTRLQIVIDETEARRFKRAAQRAGLTLSEWARVAMREAQKKRVGPSPEQRISALDRALQCAHPTADIEQMLKDIDKGRDLR